MFKSWEEEERKYRTSKVFKSWEEEGRKYQLKRHVNGARRFILCFMVELRAKSQERGSEGFKKL